MFEIRHRVRDTRRSSVDDRPGRCLFLRDGGPACQGYWQTDAVFDATVRGIRPLDPAQPLPMGNLIYAEKIVEVDVRQSWKGAQTGPLEIKTSSEMGACGFPFREGGRYLVFARRGPDGRLSTSTCSFTRAFDGARRCR